MKAHMAWCTGMGCISYPVMCVLDCYALLQNRCLVMLVVLRVWCTGMGLHAFHASAAAMLNAVCKHSCLDHGIDVNLRSLWKVCARTKRTTPFGIHSRTLKGSRVKDELLREGMNDLTGDSMYCCTILTHVDHH